MYDVRIAHEERPRYMMCRGLSARSYLRAAVEESEDLETRRLFEVNVFASLRLIKIVLPFMRARKQMPKKAL